MSWIKTWDDLEAARKIGRGVVRGSGDVAVFHTVSCSRLDAMVVVSNAEALRLYGDLAEARKAAPSIGPCAECDPEGAEIRDALNRSGTFLHEGVNKELVRMGYGTRSEVPVSVAPFLSDPSKQPHATALRHTPNDGPVSLLDRAVFQDAVAASQDGLQRRERTIDICASRQKGDSNYTAVIEVKRLDPAYVSWVFLARNGPARDYSIVTMSNKLGDNGSLQLMKIPRSDAAKSIYYASGRQGQVS